MRVEFKIGDFVSCGKVISTVVTRERSVGSYNLDPPQICFVIKMANGVITYEPIRNCRIVPNIFQRFINYVRQTFHRRPNKRRQR